MIFAIIFPLCFLVFYFIMANLFKQQETKNQDLEARVEALEKRLTNSHLDNISNMRFGGSEEELCSED